MNNPVSKNRTIRKKAAAVIMAVSLSLFITGIYDSRKVYAEEQTGYWKYKDSEVVGPDKNFDGATVSGGHGHYSCKTTRIEEYTSENHKGTCYGESVSITIDVEEPPMTTLYPGQEVKMKVNASFSASSPCDGVLFYNCKVYCNMGTNIYHNGEIPFYTADGVEGLGIDRTWTSNDYYGYGGTFFVVGGDQTFRATVPNGGNDKTLWIRHSFNHGRGEDSITTYYYYEWVDTTPTVAPIEETKGGLVGWIFGTDPTDDDDDDDDKKIDIDINSNANKNPGNQDGGFIPSGIINGWKKAKDTIGVAGGIAGAVSAIALGLATDKKKYRMVIYKEFGDTIRRGEEVIVYACIVERDEKGNEKINRDLSRKIHIFSDDGTFNVYEQDALAGDYKAAYVSICGDVPARQEDGIVKFKFTGKGGTFTNNMKFKIETLPEIIFYQENIALVAKDKKGAAIGFTVKGIDLKKIDIDIGFTSGSSYTASYVQAVTETNEPIPGTYFAVLGDINEEEGEPGTYSKHRLEITASDGKFTAFGTIDVYRVTLGLNIGVSALNCFRVPKQEAVGKNFDQLTASDFGISITKVPVLLLKVDEEAHEMYYAPAETEIRIQPIDNDDQIMKQRLDEIGLEYKFNGINEGIAEYIFYCSKKWLEPPVRPKVLLVASAVVDENGVKKKYTCEKEVMLLSQPMREEVTPSDIEKDEQIKESIFNMMVLCCEVDGLMDQLCCEFMLMETLWDSYDKHFGFDPIIISQLQDNFNKAIYQVNKEQMLKRQDYLEKLQKSANYDNNFATILSKSFAMVSEEHIDTWPGIAARIVLGVGTGGLSEYLAFMPMDVNRAISEYNERTLLCDRTTGGMLFAGSKPVVISLAIGQVISAGVWAGGGLIKACVPSSVKVGFRNWAINKTNAVIRKIPEEWVSASKEFYKAFRNTVDKINSYDPRRLLYGVRKAAAEADSLNLLAKNMAKEEAIVARNGPRSAKGLFMDKLQAVCELRAAEKLKRFKKAWDRFQYDKSGKALKEVIDSGQDIMRDTFALNALSADGRTAEEIAAKIKVANKYRAGYNWFKGEHVERPAERMIKERFSASNNVPKDNVTVYRATGKTAEELELGLSNSYDSDNSVFITDSRGVKHYADSYEAVEAVCKSYCDALGIPYKDTADAFRICAEYKIVTVYPNHDEWYRGFMKFKTTEAFTDLEIAANMKTGKHKIIEGITKMNNGIDALMKDTLKLKLVDKECDLYLSRKISKLSLETLEGASYMEKGFEGYHQGPKTYDLYVSRDISAQSLGLKSGFSQQSRVTVETLRFVENQGQYRLTMGELNDHLALNGSSCEQAISDMVQDFRTVNSNCRIANEKAGSFFWNTSPSSPLNGAVAGVSGVAGSETDD